MVSASLKVLEPVAYKLTPECLQRYLDGTQSTSPFYSDESPFGYPVAPAAILFYMPMRVEGWRDPNDTRPIFNSRVEWSFHKPVRPGTTLTLAARQSDRWLKRGRDFMTIELLALDEQGASVCRGLTTVTWPADPQHTPADLPVRDGEPSGPPAGTATGPELGTLTRQLTFEMSEAIAGPARNFHTDREMARTRGFADVVIAGPHFVCLASELLTDVFGRQWFESGELKLTYLKPVIAGERITVKAVERERQSSAGDTRVIADLWCENEAGEKTAVGSASALLE
ncbi:MAG: MaoC family dehydratase N-terminal domain-containing protein [Chloroflexi bacterium]|nr:MaoC family dehydratase N-terminal domain-containing protein [Chloroflexota bacterium]